MGKEGDISISSHILLYFPSPRPFWLAVLEFMSTSLKVGATSARVSIQAPYSDGFP